MRVEVENLLGVQNELGESPVWHPREQTLYWVNFAAHPAIYRFAPQLSKLEVFPVGVPISAIGWRQSGGLIAATCSGIAFWEAGSGMQFLENPEPSDPYTRLNDAAVDRQGRFWTGSMKVGANTSSLFRLNANQSMQRMDTGFIVSNGIGWSPDNQTCYFTDSLQHVIYAYDFDSQNGQITNRRTFVDTSREPGVPDGLTVDAQGGIWSAFCRGWKIIRYRPDGQKEFEVGLPVECPTSLAFGGPQLDQLFVTTSWGLIRETERKDQPLAGNLLRVKTGYVGLPEPGYDR